MARIKGKDIYLETDDQIYFGPSQKAALWKEKHYVSIKSVLLGKEA